MSIPGSSYRQRGSEDKQLLTLTAYACLGQWRRGRSLKGKWGRRGAVGEIEQKNASFLSDSCPERAVEGNREGYG